MTQKKIFAADKELFVLQTHLISESTEKTIQIHDFLEKIEDQETNKQKIASPRFQIAGMEFSIDVYPDSAVFDCPGFIGVFLNNYSKETLMSSVTVKEASGEMSSWEMEKSEPEAAVSGGNVKSVESFDCWNVPGLDVDILKENKTEIVEVHLICPRVDVSCKDMEGWSLVFRAIQKKKLGEQMLKCQISDLLDLVKMIL